MQDNDPAWDVLISWLQAKDPRLKDHLLVCSKQVPGAGRGLFTTEDIPPNTPLFTVPETAHMNAKTLLPLYGPYGPLIVTSLTATQLISMHLFLHRPDQGKGYDSTDSNFGPYISILPKDFVAHPLSWLISSRRESQDTDFLVDCLPPATKRALNAMADRFWEDWKVVSNFLVEHPKIAASTFDATLSSPLISTDNIETYLWAWLNVNTRCIYYRMCPSASDPNNLTLCPLLDLANHTSSSKHVTSRTPIPTFFSPSNHTLNEADEVFLTYGSHSNITLFTEYGFIEKDSPSGGQADVQDILESIFKQKGALGPWMKATLESVNYWGNWTLHDTPAPAHPSYRLLPALRLMQLSVTLSHDTLSKVPVAESEEMQAWQKTILGEKDIVSSENEERVWQQLFEICEITVTQADEGLSQLQRACQDKNVNDWMESAVEAIRSLWLEEKKVATAVMQSIKDGETID